MAHANKKQVALYVTEEENSKITEYAEKIGISRQKLMSNFINAGLDDLAIMNKYGILAIGVGVRDLAYKIRNKEIDPTLLSNGNETSLT